MKNAFKKIEIIWIMLAVTTLVTFAGCARVGYDFNANKVQEIKIGETTQDEIVVMFGQPWRKGIDNGITMWTYGRYTYRLIGQTDTKDLIVKFDDNGKVKSYTFNETMDNK